MKTRIERSEIRVTNLGGLEVCRGSVGEVWGRCVGVRRVVLGFGEVCRGGESGRGVWGRCRGGVLWKAGKGMMLEGWRAGGRELAPLYYPDTLVNPDTCQGFKNILY